MSNLKKSLRCEMRVKSILLCGFIEEGKNPDRMNERTAIKLMQHMFVTVLWIRFCGWMWMVHGSGFVWIPSFISFLLFFLSFSSLTTPIAIACSNGLIMTLRNVFTNQFNLFCSLMVYGIPTHSNYFPFGTQIICKLRMLSP